MLPGVAEIAEIAELFVKEGHAARNSGNSGTAC